MTISSATSKSGPYNGNGSTTVFAFAFKTFAAADLRVVATDAAGADTDLTLTTDYAVTLNGDQETSPGGNVTMVAAPATGTQLTILRDIDITQGADLPNQGGWYPEVVEDALDRLTMIAQQQEERINRSLQAGVTSNDPAALLADLDDKVAAAGVSAAASAASASASDASADASAASAVASAASAVLADASADASAASAVAAAASATVLANADLQTVAVTATGTCTINRMELCAAGAAIVRTIPAGTAVGDRIGFKDDGQSFLTYSLTITPPSGHRIEDLAVNETLVVRQRYVVFTLKQVSAGVWRIF